MNLHGAVLLEPKAESDMLLIPNRPVEDYVREWERDYQYKMLDQNWSGIVNNASQAVTAGTLTNTAIADASPLPDFTFSAGYLTPGMVFRVTAVGAFVSSSGATTLTIQIMYGGTGGTSLYTTGAVTLTASAGNPFKIESILRIISCGTGGATSGSVAVHTKQQGISTTANVGVPTMVRSSPASPISINTTTSNTLILTATAGVALTSFNVDTFIIEQLN